MTTDSPASILFDETGNPVGVIFDGYFYRLQVQTILTDGYNGTVSVKPPNTGAISSDPALVVAISPNNPITISNPKPSTSTLSQVSASQTNQILLPANSIRIGATIYNDSPSSLLYIKLGTIASTNNFTIRLFPLSYYEIPYGYTGEVDGIWSTSVGVARIDELTP